VEVNRDKLRAELSRDEGREAKPYVDTVGKTTIGVGRNLTDTGLRQNEIDFLLENDIEDVEGQLDASLPWWRGMSDTRQRVLANMCFNLGIFGLLKFVRTLRAMQEGRYEDAAEFMVDSKWADQVGQRAQRLAKAMREG
jgi:lysozyme